MEHPLKTIGEAEDIAPGKRKRMSFKLTPGPRRADLQQAGPL
ncbi:Uncharacterised protein [Burkholderia cepacia]|nr:hypothetical protein DM41_4228 [Burkholderia cepacia ATCC 25416]SPU74709.1 Uncharacterised protein [Burkholderia cepacia]